MNGQSRHLRPVLAYLLQRTLVPSPRAHIVFALYDGGFPAGEIVFTATVNGGGRYTERIPVAF